MTADSLNEFKCVVRVPKEIVASIVAQDLQNMTHWGGVRTNIQCTLASKIRLKSIVESTEIIDRRKNKTSLSQNKRS